MVLGGHSIQAVCTVRGNFVGLFCPFRSAVAFFQGDEQYCSRHADEWHILNRIRFEK
jgi:hypothetical protein